MDAIEAIEKRRARRNFEERDVPKETVEELIRIASLAPSPYNSQPWHFIAVRDRLLVDEIQAAIRRQAARIWKMRPFLKLVLPSLRGERIREIIEKAPRQTIHRAPLFLLVCADDSWPNAEASCAYAVQNILIAATALGLGGTHIGGVSLINRDRRLISRLNVPNGFRVVDSLVLGFPRDTPATPPRKAVSEILSWR
ncbi:MAG: hypothetical protein A2V83_00180 [Nitrospirae bacterium RBG_16_64_22]|nr:MAG: hypothetical protein A2V83_00180 [Nitrospirae bacterium RBG_16_64_22]